MIKCYVTGQKISLHTPLIASDSVNYLEAKFFFSGKEWNRSVKTAYFSNSETVIPVILIDDTIKKEAGLNLTVGDWQLCVSGVYEGTRVTTNICTFHVVPFGKTNGEPLPDITQTQAEQILSMIGDMSDLDTNAKDTLVNAINEAAKSGGSGGGGTSESITISVNGEEIEPDSRNNIEVPVDEKIGEYLQRNLGNGLKLDGSVLSVDTANAVEQDNTKPVTSAAVHVELGNIDAILKTI